VQVEAPGAARPEDRIELHARSVGGQGGAQLLKNVLHRRQHLGARGKTEDTRRTLRLKQCAGQGGHSARARRAFIGGRQRRARRLGGGGSDEGARQYRLVATDATDELPEAELWQDGIELDRGIESLRCPPATGLSIGRDLAADTSRAIRGPATERGAPLARDRKLEQARICRADPRQRHRRTVAIGKRGAADERAGRVGEDQLAEHRRRRDVVDVDSPAASHARLRRCTSPRDGGQERGQEDDPG